MKYQDIKADGGYRHVTAVGESFLTDTQLSVLKDLWRLSEKWHPVDSLFTIAPQIEKNFLVNVNRLMMIKGWDQEQAISMVGSIVCDAAVR